MKILPAREKVTTPTHSIMSVKFGSVISLAEDITIQKSYGDAGPYYMLTRDYYNKDDNVLACTCLERGTVVGIVKSARVYTHSSLVTLSLPHRSAYPDND